MKIFAVYFFMITSLFGAENNLLPNADFYNGITGYLFYDNINSDPVEWKWVDTEWGKGVSFLAPKNKRTGFDLPEVPIYKNMEYELKFMAKCSVPDQTLVVSEYYRNGSDVGARGKFYPKLSDTWANYSFRYTPRQQDDWCGFRFLMAGQNESRITIANLFLGPVGGKQKPLPLSTRLEYPQTNYCLCGGEEFKAKLIVTNATSTNQPVSAKWAMLATYYNNEIISGGTINEIAAPGSNTFDIRIIVPKRNGIYRIESCINENLSYKNILQFSVSPKIRAQSGDLPVDIGINNILSPTDRWNITDDELMLFANCGLSFIRVWDNGNPFIWREIEPKEGQYDWARCDQFVEAAKRVGINLLPVIGGMFFTYPDTKPIGVNPPSGHALPVWLYQKGKIVPCSPGRELFTSKGRKTLLPPMENWENIVREISTRYHGKIMYYEIMNEPNLYFSEEQYVPYLKRAYEITREVSPSAKVIGISATGDYKNGILPYAKKCFDLNAGQYLDAISFHPYDCLYEDSKDSGEAAIDGINSQLADHKLSVVKKWNTEVYYLNPSSNVGEDPSIFHAGYLIRRYLLDAAKGVQVSIPLPGAYLVGFSPLINENIYNFGSTNIFGSRGLIPNERYVATAAFANLLFDTKFKYSKSIPGNFRAYLFAGKGKAIAAVFALNCEKNDQRKLEFHDISSKMDIVDLLGNPLDRNPAGGLALSASFVPIYLVAPDVETLNAVLDSAKVAGIAPVKTLSYRAVIDQDNKYRLISTFTEQIKGAPLAIGLTSESAQTYVFSDARATVSLPTDSSIARYIYVNGQKVDLNLPEPFVINQLTNAPSISEDSADSIWKKATIFSLGNRNTAYIGHYNKKLYFRFVINDNDIERKSGQALWLGDSVELFLDAAPMEHPELGNYLPGKTHQFIIAPETNECKSSLSGSTNYYRTKCEYFTKKTNEGYLVDVSIPFNEFNITTNGYVGIAFKVNDYTQGVRKEFSYACDADSHLNRLHFGVGRVSP